MLTRFSRSKAPAATGPEEIAGYRNLERVGAGGFSVVYRAYDERHDRTVALKVLTASHLERSDVRRFEAECRAAGRLTGHPNVVTVLGTGRARSGRPYMAMEYFERGTLRARLEREGPLPVADVLGIGVKMAGALMAAHSSGIVHGDLKPQNILVSRWGEPALADFGIARALDSTEPGSGSGTFTAYHAAPEVIVGQPPEPASDLYSLGSTLHHLLAGRPAFQREGDAVAAAVLVRIVGEEPPDILRPDIPSALKEFLRRAMAKQPSDRFPDAQAMALALQALETEQGLLPTRLPGKADEAVPSRVAELPSAPARESTSALETTLPPWGSAEFESRRGASTGASLEDLERTQPRPGRMTAASKASLQLPPVAVLVAAAAVLLVGAGLGVGIRAAIGSRPEPSPSATPRVGPANLVVDTPIGLSVVDAGPSAALRWELPPSAENLPIVVQSSNSASPAWTTATWLSSGATSTTVAHLEARVGYCFRVGTVVSLGKPSVVAISTPVCIRGGIPPSPTPGLGA